MDEAEAEDEDVLASPTAVLLVCIESLSLSVVVNQLVSEEPAHANEMEPMESMQPMVSIFCFDALLND